MKFDYLKTHDDLSQQPESFVVHGNEVSQNTLANFEPAPKFLYTSAANTQFSTPGSKDSQNTSGARAESLKNYNLRLLADTALMAPSPLSRADLASITGLNRSTVTRLVDHLISFGILREANSRIISSGRPAIPLTPSRHTHVAIGASVKADNLSAGIMDLSGDILAERHHQFSPATEGPENTLKELTEILQSLLLQIEDTKLVLSGITCGFSGVISATLGILHSSTRLGWKSVNLREQIDAKLNCGHQVNYQNSTTLGAIAENIARRKAHNQIKNFIYISGSTGVGSSIVRNGVLESGSHGWAGEVGHIPVSDLPRQCSCGAQGCLDAFLGKSAIFEAAGLKPDAPWGHLYAALDREEVSAIKALNDAGRYLGRALSSYINIVDISNVVIGGNLGHLFPYLAPTLSEELSVRVQSSQWQSLFVSQALTGSHATIEGAAWSSLLDLLRDPERWKEPSESALSFRPVDETPRVFLSPKG